MQKNLLWLILFFFPFFSSAQSNYKPGYIVNLKKDTLKGYIDYKEWIKNPKQFYFKRSLSDGAPQSYSVNNATAFAITNLEFYKKAIVKSSDATVDVSNLTASIDTSFVVDTVFLKLLSTGKNLSLYSLTDTRKIHFYVEEKSTHIINELNFYAYLSNTNIRTVYTYRNQLKDIANIYKPNQDDLFKRIDNAEYVDGDLKKVVALINGGEDKDYKTEKLSKTQFFAGLGVKQSKITYNGSNGVFPPGYNKSSTSPTLSFGTNFIVNKNTEKLIIRFEVALSDDKYNFYYATPGNTVTSATLDLKQFTAAIMPQIIYNFYSTKPLKVFVDVGASLNISVYNNYSYVSQFFDNTSTTQNKYPEFNKGWASFPVKAGVVINEKIELFAAYSFATSIISNNSFGANIKSYQAGINYMF